MKTRECVAVLVQVLFGIAKVLGERGLRQTQIGLLKLHMLPRIRLGNRNPKYRLLHRQRNVVCMK
jgi:hypothetical protein